jgi:hypothetical protein
MSEGSVAELVKGLHDEAGRALVDVLGRYSALVRKAADDKLSHDEAVAAASIAYEMGLPADRFDRDVGVVKAERALAAQMERDLVAQGESRAKGAEFRALLKALEQEIRNTKVAMHRHGGEGMNRAQRRQDHARLIKEHPHLFKPADTLSDSEWQAVRTVK